MNKPWTETESVIQNQKLELGITVTIPEGTGAFPAVLLCGGSMSHFRDGDLVLDNVQVSRKAIRKIAHHLALWGIASIRWDKVGYGQSRIISGNPPENSDHVSALHLAWEHLEKESRIDKSRILIAGESAGAYYACLFAGTYGHAFAYMLLGGLGSSTETLFEFNYKRTVLFAAESPRNRRWVEENALRALAVGLSYEDMFEQARKGKEVYQMTWMGHSREWYLPPLREQLEQDLLSLYANLKRPVLVIQGEHDMNVPPGDASMIASFIRESGNPDVTKVIVPGADHNFQKTPETYEERLRERISLSCLDNPYSETFYRELKSWLATIIP